MKGWRGRPPYHKAHPAFSPPPSSVSSHMRGPRRGSRTQPRTRGHLLRSHASARQCRGLREEQEAAAQGPGAWQAWGCPCPCRLDARMRVLAPPSEWRPPDTRERIEVTVPSIKMGSAFKDVSERESSAACLNFRDNVSVSSISPVTGLDGNHKTSHLRKLH